MVVVMNNEKYNFFLSHIKFRIDSFQTDTKFSIDASEFNNPLLPFLATLFPCIKTKIYHINIRMVLKI